MNNILVENTGFKISKSNAYAIFFWAWKKHKVRNTLGNFENDLSEHGKKDETKKVH